MSCHNTYKNILLLDKECQQTTTSSDENVKEKSKKIDKKASQHEPNSHKRTIVCEFNKLLFLYSHSEKKLKSYAKKHFFCAVQKFVCIFVLYFDKYIYLFIFYEAPFSSVCCACTVENKNYHACIIFSFPSVHVYVLCLLYNNCWCC